MRPDASAPLRSFSRFTARGAAPWALLGAVALAAALITLGPTALGGGLRRLERRVSPPAPPALSAAPGDTQAVYGPKPFDTPTGSATYHVERFAVAVTPGQRYTLQVDNGGVTGGSVVLNGSTILSASDLGSGAARWTRVVQALAEDTIQVTVQGPAGAAVTVSVLSAPDASFLVFGNPDGTQRISSATILVNGLAVLSQSELNQQVGGLIKDVTFQRGDNTVDITLTAKPNGFLDLCFTATDVTPPVITINEPTPNFITRETQVVVSGTVHDETPTTVLVNGQPATMVSPTSFTATVALSTEGSNRIQVHATDAAGLSTDSTRTVIHDTQPPVLTLTSPADGLITREASVTVAGTVTDLTAVTVNVNGVPFAVDGTGSFSGPVALTEGTNILSVTATDAAGNTTTQVRQVTLDTHPPVLAVSAPANGLITNQPTVSVSGSETDATAVTVTVNGTPLAVGPDGHFSGSVALTEGSNTLITVATDAAGNATTDTRTVTLDTHPPVLAVTAPTDGLITRQTPVTVSGTVTDATPVTVDVNGIPLPVDGAGVFTGQVPLAEGANPLTVTARDAATNTATIVRIVTLDTHAPVIAVAQPADGDVINAASVTTSGTVTDATATTLTINGNPVGLSAGGNFSAEVPLVPNANTITYAATDAAGNSATTSITVTRKTSNLPPDPSLVASVVNRAEVTTIGANTAFLYSGETPIQTGVAPGTINPVRAAVIRGRVLDRTFAALGGATVTVLNHPELGQTLSRDDGGYDLAVNGGGPLTVSFVKAGYFPAQRTVDVSWQDYTTLDDVILLQPDPAVTVVDLTASAPAVARGTVVSDVDGSRQATVMFKPGTQATLTLPDGSTQSLTSLSIRATEYTVGDSGMLSMPAPLPPASQYTYAVQLSADEQLAAGPGAQLSFSQPAVFYVDNFLHVPDGTRVPLGGYDATTGTWVPQPSGITLKVLGTDATGRAQVDITGDGVADPPSALATLGIDDYELLRLGGTYPAGADLWRALVPRIMPEDLNFPWVFVGTVPTDGKVRAGCSSREGDPLRCQLQAQTAFQTVGIVGSPFTLNYASDRTQGNAADRRLDITLTGPTLQDQLKRVELEVDVAGKRFTGSFDPVPNLTYTFTWDGKDIYGRLVQGTQAATVLIGYVFPVEYAAPAGSTDAFGLPCAPSGTGTVCTIIANAQTGARAERTLVQRLETSIGTLDATALGLGGFTLDVQQVYDPVGEVLYRGDGTRRASAALPPGIRTVIGGCTSACVTTGPALRAQIGQVFGMVFAPDGTLYFSDVSNSSVRRVTPDGIISIFAGGCGIFCPYGDGGPATQANLGIPRGLALGPDGSLYIADGSGQSVVRRVLPNGIITTVAGTRTFGYNGDNIPAATAQLSSPVGLTFGPDGALYIGDGGNSRIRRIGPDGIITTVAGDGNRCGPAIAITTDADFNALCGNGIAATKSRLLFPTDVQFGPDGALYIADPSVWRIRRVGPDGVMRTFAGSAVEPFQGNLSVGDGGPATQAGLGTPATIAFGSDGSLYIGEGSTDIGGNNFRVRRVTPNGIITTFAGTGVFGFSGDGGPAPAARLQRAGDVIGVGPDGNLYNGGGGRIRKVSGFLPAFAAGQTVVASQDGRALYLFSSAGRQLYTLDATTGAVLFAYAYNENRQLVSITNRDGRVTQIERDGAGRATAMVTPDGVRTAFVLDAAGNLSGVMDGAGHQLQLGYAEGGLLSSTTDPNGTSQSYAYDALGNLLASGDPTQPFLSVGRSDLGGVPQVTGSSGLGLTLSVQDLQLPTGEFQKVVTLPNRLTVTTTTDPTGRSVTHSPGGTTVVLSRKPDPRFGMESPLIQEIVTTPGGLTRDTRVGRSITLSDSLNPLSLVSQTDSLIINGRVRTSSFAKATGRATVTQPSGRQVVMQLDANERITSVLRAGLATINKSYDAQGRLIRLAQGSDSTSYRFNAAGLLTSMTDGLGRSQEWDYDAAGRLTRRVLQGGRTIDLAYDANGNLTAVTPPGRPAHRFTYTGTNLLESYTPPDVGGGVADERYAYNGDGQLLRIDRTDGSSVSFSYDAVGRKSQVTFPDAAVAYQYDLTTGRLAQVTSAGETVSYGYDGDLRTSVMLGGAVSGSLSMTYNNDFRVISDAVDGQPATQYTYDQDGLLVTAGQLIIGRAPRSGIITGTTLGNVTTAVTVDSLGHVAELRAAVGGTSLWTVDYTRDAIGRVTGLSEAIGSDSPSNGFTYDDAGRVLGVTRDGVQIASYEYDLNGNRVRETTPAGVITGQYDAQDRLVAYGDASYQYSANGDLQARVVGGLTTAYHYDALGNLRSVTLSDGTRIDYVLDGEGRRVGKKVNGALVRGFLYAGAIAPLAELDGNNAVVSVFVYGTRPNVPDYLIKTGRTYRIIVDPLGSVRFVVDVQTGEIVQRLDYDAFGLVTLNTNPDFQPFGFGGGLCDAQTGLTHFGARDYDAATGRWTTKDPILLEGGDPNLYSFAQQDPLNRQDPQGTFSLLEIEASAEVSTTVEGIAAEHFLRGCATSIYSDLLDEMFFKPQTTAAGTIVKGCILSGLASTASGGLTDALEKYGGLDALGPIKGAALKCLFGAGISGAGNMLKQVADVELSDANVKQIDAVDYFVDQGIGCITNSFGLAKQLSGLTKSKFFAPFAAAIMEDVFELDVHSIKETVGAYLDDKE